MWRASLRSTAARAHLPRQVPECGWATHSVHKPHRHHGSSQVVFGDAGGVTPPEVIPIHRAASHPLGPLHGPMWRTEVPIYNSHNGEGMQTRQGHLQRHIREHCVFQLVSVNATVRGVHSANPPAAPEIPLQHAFLRDMRKISGAQLQILALLSASPLARTPSVTDTVRRALCLGPIFHHGPYLGIDRRTPYFGHLAF